MAKPQVSVLGCGWLGLPLSGRLRQSGYHVRGSTTSKFKLPLLKRKGITPFWLCISPEGRILGDVSAFFKNSDIVILNFPPARVDNIEQIYPAQMRAVLKHIPASAHVLFVSSTSVYPNTNGWVREDCDLMPDKPSGKACLAAEKEVQAACGAQHIVLRAAGLVGEDRLPGRFLAGKKNLKNAQAPINVVHQADLINLIERIILRKAWGHCLNACADKHPDRKTYYTKAAELIGLSPPHFLDENQSHFKRVSNQKSKDLLNYTYLYPDPLTLLV